MQNKKQEKILHARISNDLYEKIADKARKHRVSTSNLIRNLVEDYLEIHGDVWDALDDKIRGYLDKSKNNDSLLGYQELMLNKDTKCALCDAPLKKGVAAYMGFFENSAHTIVVCSDCKNTSKSI